MANPPAGPPLRNGGDGRFSEVGCPAVRPEQGARHGAGTEQRRRAVDHVEYAQEGGVHAGIAGGRLEHAIHVTL